VSPVLIAAIAFAVIGAAATLRGPRGLKVGAGLVSVGAILAVISAITAITTDA